VDGQAGTSLGTTLPCDRPFEEMRPAVRRCPPELIPASLQRSYMSPHTRPTNANAVIVIATQNNIGEPES
jgi:hypothetical protein